MNLIQTAIAHQAAQRLTFILAVPLLILSNLSTRTIEDDQVERNRLKHYICIYNISPHIIKDDQTAKRQLLKPISTNVSNIQVKNQRYSSFN